MEKKGQRSPLDTTMRLIDSRLYNYLAIKQAIEDTRLDSGHAKTIIPGHAFISDTTANTAVKNLSEIERVVIGDGIVVTHPERWVKVIETMYYRAGYREQRALELRYNEGRNYSYITEHLNLSNNVLYSIINDARNFILAGACQMGMIRVIK